MDELSGESALIVSTLRSAVTSLRATELALVVLRGVTAWPKDQWEQLRVIELMCHDAAETLAVIADERGPS